MHSGVCNRILGRQLWESMGPYLVSIGFEVQVSGGISFFLLGDTDLALVVLLVFVFLYLFSDRKRGCFLVRGSWKGG